MSGNNCTGRRTLSFVLLVFLALTIIIASPKVLNAQDFKNKKAVIFVVDNVSLNELIDSNTPNFHSLMKRGGIAQMNIRAKSSLSNRGSSYLSLALGVRTLASTMGGQAYDKEEMVFLKDALPTNHMTSQRLYQQYSGERLTGQVVNLAIADTKRTSLLVTPKKLNGLLGEVAGKRGLTVGLVGNSDTSIKRRESTMLAMDKEGQITYGSVGSDLLQEDLEVLGGVRLNEKRLLQEVEKILPKVDILFIDYGDTVRVQDNYLLAEDRFRAIQKFKALHRADSFLGNIMSKLDLSNTLFMVISPNPSRESVQAGNFGLTPIIIAAPNIKQGLLISNTTRRSGLVANFDFAPTILNFFKQSSLVGYVGEPMESIQHSDPVDKLLQDQRLFLELRKNRSTFHWTYIAITASILFLLLFKIKCADRGNLDRLSQIGLLFILAIPVTLLYVSKLGYVLIIFDLAFMLGGALIIAIFAKAVFRNLLLGIGILSLFTTLLLLIDVFFIKELMINSPLGSDAIAGNRFYGIGNDFMGILLGSSVLGLFTLFDYFKVDRAFQTICTTFLFTFVIVGLSPMFGANIGGTLSALAIFLLALLLIYDKKISFGKIIGLVSLVIVIIFTLAVLDASKNPNPTHAGKAIASLKLGGWGSFIEIVSVKLGQVVWNLVHAHWNILLFLEVIVLIWFVKSSKNYIEEFKIELPILSKGFTLIFWGTVVVFLFNDTGTIASSLMLIYLVFPLITSKEFY